MTFGQEAENETDIIITCSCWNYAAERLQYLKCRLNTTSQRRNQQCAIRHIWVRVLRYSSDTPYFVALLSQDGHFFYSTVIKWSADDFRGAKADERNFWKIQEAEERAIKRITLEAPANDKDMVALKTAYNAMKEEGIEKHQRKLQEYLQKGDLVSFAKLGENPWEPSTADINGVCNRYIQVKVVDKGGLLKLQYPQGETKLIATWSGKGSFTSPTFTVIYDRLKTSWVGTPSGQFEYKLYTADGKFTYGTRLSAEPDKKHGGGGTVRPGSSYYIEIIAPVDMQWTFWLEETNLPSEAD